MCKISQNSGSNTFKEIWYILLGVLHSSSLNATVKKISRTGAG